MSSGRIGHCDVGPEDGIINPHPVKDHPNASCQGDHGALCSTAARNLRCTCSQPRRTPVMHHNGRGLTQGAAQVDVSGLGYPSRDMAFARLVSRRCEANPWPHFFRRRESGGIIDRRLEGQRDNCADARHGHQSVAYWIILRQVADTPLQSRQFLPLACPRPEHRFCRSFKHGIAHGQFPDAKFKPATGDGTDLKPEVSEQPP